MSCNKVDIAILQDLLDETIDPLEKIFIENHLKSCKECRRELSELKLTFWELDNKSNYSMDIPSEIDSMGIDLINKYLDKGKSNSRKVIDAQVNNIKMSSKFLKYIPGAKKTSKTVKAVSKGLTKEVIKLLAK